MWEAYTTRWVKLSLVNAFWVKVNGKLMIKAKMDSGEWRYVDPRIHPYFFIRAKDYDKACKLLNDAYVSKGDYVTTRGEPCLKVEVDFPNQVKTLREKLKKEGIPTYEADVTFVRRWMIDSGIRVSRKPKVLYFDVEADSRKGIWIPEEGKPPDQRILSIAGVGSDGREYFICYDDEVEIFHEFKKLMEYYDLLVGYNNLRWDNPFLEARAKVLGIPLNMKITNWQDMMLLYNKSWGGGHVSLKLDKVAEKELGERKKLNLYKYKGAEGIWKMFQEDRGALREYNLWDAMLLKMLNDKLGCLDIAIEMAYLSHCLYQDALFNSRIVDGLLLRRSLMRTPRVVYQNKYGMAYKFGTYVRGEEKKRLPEEPYTGGLVIDPKPGLFHDVIDFDFSSLYPRTMMTFNIGVETLSEKGEILSGNPNARFVKKPRSIIAEFLEELNDLRIYYRELLKQIPPSDPRHRIYNIKQFELKILLNATSGVIGAYGFRFYDRDVAESITLTGRELLKTLMDILIEHGFEILYADTDGVFARKEGFDVYKFKEKEKTLLWIINDELKHRVIKRFNVPPEYYCEEVKVDNVYQKIFFSGVKKRYVGEIYDFTADISVLDDWRVRDESLKGIPLKRNIVGFDIIRLDVPQIVKDVQNQIFDIIFNSQTREEIRKKTKEVLREIHTMLFSGKLDNKLVIEKGTRRELDKYKSEDVHVKIARELAKRGIFRPGDAIEYVIVDVGEDGVVGAPVLENEPFPRITFKGYSYYWERVLNVVERVLGEKIDPFTRSLEDWT